MDITEYNREAWDREVKAGNPWTRTVEPHVTEAARRGDWQILLTPAKPVPRDWFGALEGQKVLCLASGGGQQGPVPALRERASRCWTTPPHNSRRIDL